MPEHGLEPRVWRSTSPTGSDAYGQRVNKKLIQAIMRDLGIAGLSARRKGKPNLVNRVTTVDLVNREFHREGRNAIIE